MIIQKTVNHLKQILKHNGFYFNCLYKVNNLTETYCKKKLLNKLLKHFIIF